MKISILQKLIIFSFIILAGNLFIGYTVYKSNQKLLNSQQWVQHTEQVISQSGNILLLVKDFEIASKGFVITNDSSFLEPFKQVKITFAYIGQLRQLTRDNPLQQQRIDSLNFYLHKYLDFTSQTVELRSKQGLASAITHISTKKGKQYAGRIYQITNTIQQEEFYLLKQRKQTNGRSVAALNWVTMGMYILMAVLTMFLLLAAVIFLFQHKQKEKKAAELIVINKELNFQYHENEKQDAANKELEAFSYSVSHDLRAPLRHIGGFVDLLIKNNSTQLNETGLRYLNIISESSQEMGNLIDALLTFSRLSRTELNRTTVNSKGLITHVLNTFSDELAGRNIEINISELPDTRGDESLINQVWVNLISNALKYSRNKEKAVIDIGGKIEDNETIFHIRDNGAGFDMKYADKLFGVFQRLHKARDFEGIGIGLANVNRIIVRHGGKCWAEGEVGNGAAFFFSIPNN